MKTDNDNTPYESPLMFRGCGARWYALEGVDKGYEVSNSNDNDNAHEFVESRS